MSELGHHGLQDQPEGAKTPVRLAILVPTFNDAELQECLESLECPVGSSVQIVVINAGDPIAFTLPENAIEVKVDSACFWTASVEAGFEFVRKNDFDFVMLANADNTFFPGSIRRLLELAQSGPNIVSVSPAYIKSEDGSIRLLYSDQLDLGFLLYGKLNRRWTAPDEAPETPFEIQLTGGQGVVFSTDLLGRFEMDVKRFPHHAGDHDLWLRFRKAGMKLLVEPKAGVVNLRVLGGKHAHGFRAKVKKLMWRLGSDLTQDSPKVMWRLRAKHLPFPLAVFSFLISFGARWTIGFPKLLKRT